MKADIEIEKIFSEHRPKAEHVTKNTNAKIKTGLHLKFSITITLVIVSIILILFLFFHQNSVFAVRTESDRWGFNLTKMIAHTMQQKGVPTAEEIERLGRTLLSLENIAYLQILRPDGQPFVQVVKNSKITIVNMTQDERHLQMPSKKIFATTSNSRILEYRMPIVFEKTTSLSSDVLHFGMIRVGILQTIQHDIYHIRSFTIALFITIFVALGVGIAWFFSHSIIVPLQKLVRAMKLVADEEVQFDENGLPMGKRFRRVNDFELNIHTQDEIEQLADEFNIMLVKLEKSYQKLEQIIKDKNDIVKEKSKLADNLKELNRKNEVIIKERTREVVEKNLRLYEIFEELQFQKEELISMNAQLEKISRMKSEFLANMSHELRTPMNSILGFTEVLREKMFGELNEKQEKYLYNIHTSGRHLLQLINNILDISKVEAGKMKLVIEPYSVNRVIEEVQGTIRTLAYKKNIDLRSELAADVVMHGDVSKFKQILYNLISNAIKFTEEKGEVVVETQEIKPNTYFKGGAGADAFQVDVESVLLTIRDNGIGIKPEDQNRIFIEFEQADQTRKRRYEGTGLGLALTRKLVHLHKGAIWLESKAEKGTTLFVVLPVKTMVDESENQEDGCGLC